MAGKMCTSVYVLLIINTRKTVARGIECSYGAVVLECHPEECDMFSIRPYSGARVSIADSAVTMLFPV